MPPLNRPSRFAQHIAASTPLHDNLTNSKYVTNADYCSCADHKYRRRVCKHMKSVCESKGTDSMGDKCLTKACRNPSAAVTKRGLCLQCYSKAKKMVEAGTTTWDELTALGLSLDADEQCDPFLAAFNAAKRDNTNKGD